MKLVDGRGASLTLEIAGYQFTSADQSVNSTCITVDDCNWIMVNGMVVPPPPGKCWEFTDPCLNTVELKNLADWFGKISASPIPRTISFMEPNLRLSFLPLPKPVDKVSLYHECASPWNRRTFPGYDELHFPSDCNDLAQISHELHDLASRFPPRIKGGRT